MANVYDRINEFYIEHPDIKVFFAKKAIEEHIRKCAWKGGKENDLFIRFALFEKLLLFALDIDADTVYELLPEDYLEIFYELADEENKKLDENLVKKYMAFLEELYLEREEEGFSGKIDEIESLRMFFYDEGRFCLLKREDKESYKSRYRRGRVSDEEIDARDSLKDEWLDLIQKYFNDEYFKDDLNRAYGMFFGGILPKGKKGSHGFRDYFLFDYHLIQTDETPLSYFYRKEKDKTDEELILLIEEFLTSRFTFFYVKYTENDIFLCGDLFREREFILPFSAEDFPEYKNMIFYGHIGQGSVPEPTYLGWFFANERLQKRFVEEITAAYKLYRYNNKKADFTDFFSRHSLAAREILDALVNFSQLNVIPKAEDIEIIRTNEDILEDYDGAVKKLVKMGKEANLSAYSLKLLKKYYHDFLVKSKLSRTKNESQITLFAVLNNFIDMNMGKQSRVEENQGSMSAQVSEMSAKIRDTLKSDDFDPRYLTEEGFSRLISFFERK